MNNDANENMALMPGYKEKRNDVPSFPTSRV